MADTDELEWTRVPGELDSGASASLIGLNFLTRKMKLIQGDHIHNEARRVTGVDGQTHEILGYVKLDALLKSLKQKRV